MIMQGSNLSLTQPNNFHRRSNSHIKPNSYKYTVSVSEIAQNTSGKTQYAGETVKYTIPDSRAYTYKANRY